MPFSSQQSPPQSDSWRNTECMRAFIANVFPAPVSPVMSQPRQKSFRFQTNPAREAVVAGFLEVSGAQHQPTGKLTNRGRKLIHPTIGSNSQPSVRQIAQSRSSGIEWMYENLNPSSCLRIQWTAAADACPNVDSSAAYLLW